MKAIITSAILLCCLAISLFGQELSEMLRGIEVSGTAERMVTPDEFTFRIILSERQGARGKVTIDQQEAGLRAELGKAGIDVQRDLSTYDISAAYVRRRKDTLATQDYRLKIRDLSKIAPIQDIADRLNISYFDLVESTNSHIEDIRRDVKIEAMKAARTKAEYLMAAIGGRVGKAIYIRDVEVEEGGRQGFYGFLGNTATASNTSVQPLSFTQQRVRSSIVARFEIE